MQSLHKGPHKQINALCLARLKVSGCYRAMGIVFFQNKGFADMCFFDCADPYSAETAAEKKEALDFARQARQLHGAFSP